MIELSHIRSQFPILSTRVNNQPLVYLDNGATSQKPQRVLDVINTYYSTANANIHRGVHSLSRLATEQFEDARKTIAAHFGLKNPQQLIFTAGTTDSINMVAQSLAGDWLLPGDEIILTQFEHHSNILPWQLWAQKNGGVLKVIPLTDQQVPDYSRLPDLIGPKTKLIAITQVSNTLGVITDVAAVMAMAKSKGIAVLIDGAQSAPHMAIDLQALNPDFFVCSAHKMYGPTGIGALVLSDHWLSNLKVSKTGGGIIKTVRFTHTEYAEGATRFEPGTPHIAGALGFAEAVRFMDTVGMDAIYGHELSLVNHLQDKLSEIPEVIQYGVSDHKAGVVSFNVKGQHPFDVGTLLDKYGIAVRTGHHCTQPLMEHLGIQGTVRASFAVYNTPEEVDFLVEKLKKVIQMLS